MNKMTIALASCGGAVALGMVLMSVGTQAVLENVVQGHGEVSSQIPLEIRAEMGIDEKDAGGVFAVQMYDTGHGARIMASVLDPFGTEITSADVKSESVEGKFDVGADGTYTLLIQSDIATPVQVFGAIGPVPDPNAKALAFIPFYVLLAGIMGMAGMGVYWVANSRRRARHSRGF